MKPITKRRDGSEERGEREAEERRPVVMFDGDRDHVGAEPHKHGVPEADQPGRIDQEVETESEQAKVESLLREQDLWLAAQERHQSGQDDHDDRESPQTLVGLLVGARARAYALRDPVRELGDVGGVESRDPSTASGRTPAGRARIGAQATLVPMRP